MRSKKFPLIDNNASITELIPYFERLLNAQVYRSDVVSQFEISKTNFLLRKKSINSFFVLY